MTKEIAEPHLMPELGDFRQKLETLEVQLHESVESVLDNQKKSRARLDKYLQKLPIEPNNKRYIMNQFELEQNRVHQNNQLVSELNDTLEELLSILQSKSASL